MYVACWRHITIPITSNYQPILKIIENFVTCLCSACYIASKRCEFIWQLGSSADNFGFKIPMLVLKTRQRVQRRSAKKNVWKNMMQNPWKLCRCKRRIKGRVAHPPLSCRPLSCLWLHQSVSDCKLMKLHQCPWNSTNPNRIRSENVWSILTISDS